MEKIKLIEIMKSELKPSLGCTEPAAVGLAVSKTCCKISGDIKKIKLTVSSNIFKNAYCVKIPKTKSSGIYIAAVLGYLLKEENNTMELFEKNTPEIEMKAKELISSGFVEIKVEKSQQFFIHVTCIGENDVVKSKTYDRHDNLVYMEKNGEVLISKDFEHEENICNDDDLIKSKKISSIIRTAMKFETKEIEFLKDSIEMNIKASDEGLKNDYGLRIGKSIKKMMDSKALSNDLPNYVKMRTAAASDCRMGGGDVPAMTLLGSGNQGFENILPVVATAEFYNLEEDKLLKAVAISMCVAIYIKYNIGRLSPICGAIFTGAGASCGICYLLGGNEEQMVGSVFNMLGNLTGMICDGAKDGCALKLATCASEAAYSAKLAIAGSVIEPTDGIISTRFEDTVSNVEKLSKEAMQNVDMDIINIMLQKK